MHNTLALAHNCTGTFAERQTGIVYARIHNCTLYTYARNLYYIDTQHAHVHCQTKTKP